MEDEQIRVLVVQIDRVQRELLMEALARQPGLVTYGWSKPEPKTLHETIVGNNINIALLNFDWLCELGLQSLRALSEISTDVRILAMGLPDKEAVIVKVIEAGAAGVATHDTSFSELTANIRAVLRGDTLCSPHVAGLVFSQLARIRTASATEHEVQLTRREKQIAALIEQGLTNKAIARQLCISIQTVKNHVHNILRKLDLQRRTEVAHYARYTVCSAKSSSDGRV